jgi:FkbM family methyltransferase
MLKRFLESILPERTISHLQALDHYLHGEEEIRLLSAICPKGREAIDAGANIGTYSYFLSKYASAVYAYEPNPGLAARLKRILPRVNVRNVALSDSAGEVVLRVPCDSNGNIRHELASISQRFDGQVQEFSVEATTIDSEQINNVGFIKIDVEQHEKEVLRGAMNTIARCRPNIMTEISPLRYKNGLREYFSFLTDVGYRGWFRFDEIYMPIEQFVDAVHANPKNFGDRQKFVANNLLLFPAETKLAAMGPQG